MGTFLSIAASAAFFATVLWTSVEIVDRGNGRNTWGVAIGIGVLFAVFANIAGFLLVLLPLVALGLLLLRYYELTFGRAVVVIVLMFVLSWVFGAILQLAMKSFGLA